MMIMMMMMMMKIALTIVGMKISRRCLINITSNGLRTLSVNRKIILRHKQLLISCLGRISRLSLIRHSLYVGVVEKLPPPTTHRGAVWKDGVEIH